MSVSLLMGGCGGAAVHGETAGSAGDAGEPTRVADLPALAPTTDAQHTSPPEEEIEPVAVPIAGTELTRGRATVEVRAPLAVVRDAVLGFGSYAEFMPHYEACRLLGRTPSGARDVYMEISALHGALKMWARIEVAKTVEGGVETVEARFVEGNVEDFEATWKIRRLDALRTELSLEVFLQPKLPLPAQIVNSENLKGSVKGVLAMRARAEQAAAPKR